jgi:quinol monooxygenase YgiN
VFSLQIIVPDERRTVLLHTLAAMLGPTRAAPGCLEARLYSDLDRRKTLLLVEDWDSREQFEQNLDAAKLNAIVAAIELSSEAPVVRIDTVERRESVRQDERNDQYANKASAHRLGRHRWIRGSLS